MFKTLMKWVSRAWESPSVPITSEAIRDVFCAAPNMSGVNVTRDVTFGIPPFFRGVDLIASSIGRVDVPTYKSTSKYDGKVKDYEHAAFNLLMFRPNKYQTPFEFKRQLAQDGIMGNGYAFVERDENTAKPISLTNLDPDNTYPVVVRSLTKASDVEIYYVTQVEGSNTPIVLDASEVIHIKSLCGKHGVMGMRLIDVLKESLGLAVAVTRFASVYFNNAGSPSMVIEVPEYINNKDQLEQLKEVILLRQTGLQNAHRIMILQGGAKVSKGFMSAEDAQIINADERTAIHVANILGLPPSKLGANITTSYGSLEEEYQALETETIGKWFCNIEQQLERTLLTDFERIRGTRTICFDRSKLLEEDHSENIDNLIKLVNNGLLLPNYACAELNLPALPEESNKIRLPAGVTLPTELPEEEAEPPSEDTPPPPPGATPGAKAPEDTQRLHALTESVLRRFVTRVEKSPGGEHLPVLVDTLAPLVERSEAVAEGLLKEMVEKLPNVTQADIEGWTERILT